MYAIIIISLINSGLITGLLTIVDLVAVDYATPKS